MDFKKSIKGLNKKLINLRTWLGLLDKIFAIGAYTVVIYLAVYGLRKLGLEFLPSFGIVVGLTYIIFRRI